MPPDKEVCLTGEAPASRKMFVDKLLFCLLTMQQKLAHSVLLTIKTSRAVIHVDKYSRLKRFFMGGDNSNKNHVDSDSKRF
ncbi:MAG: hypothetical protein A3F13_07740 [Gammaproteobacteria bacterium RIFCSPHIGHO2_12_FULL_40_19]|nr:MAG: hypothetical protein A3F13_07740 [Gammaproteobacteria bacterium RIFCSPHIGHO2_12_FULL_40_19]